MFSDNFNRADEILDAGANWTAVVGGRDRLEVDNNRLESNGTDSSQEAYLAPDQGSADMYAEADWLGSTFTTDYLAVRLVSNTDLIGMGPGAGSTIRLAKIVGGTVTTFGSVSNAGVLRWRIEVEGTTVRGYVDTGSGFGSPFHTETGVTDHATNTRAGFRTTAVGGTDGVALWDNFETGALAAPKSAVVVMRRRRGY
jgi:hypothetical protein